MAEPPRLLLGSQVPPLYFTYWQRCRERQHRQFHTNLKIQHAMMMKTKKMVDMYDQCKLPSRAPPSRGAQGPQGAPWALWAASHGRHLGPLGPWALLAASHGRHLGPLGPWAHWAASHGRHLGPWAPNPLLCVAD